jgi:hypothetical protein
MVFCAIYAIISVICIINHLKINNGLNSLFAIIYMSQMVWTTICICNEGAYKTGLLWYITVWTIFETFYLMFSGKVSENKRKVILLNLIIISFSIGLAI